MATRLPGVLLLLRGDGDVAQLAFDDMENRRITGTNDWFFCQSVLEMPEITVGVFSACISKVREPLLTDLALVSGASSSASR